VFDDSWQFVAGNQKSMLENAARAAGETKESTDEQGRSSERGFVRGPTNRLRVHGRQWGWSMTTW